MERVSVRPRFVVIPGGKGMEGPIGRLGLRNRFSPVSSRVWAVMALGKILLLASLLYVYFG